MTPVRAPDGWPRSGSGCSRPGIVGSWAATGSELFRAALGAPQPPFTVLHVHGPGGVGKTALLRAFADEARTAGAVSVPLDARHFEPSPAGFTAAVRAATGLEDDEDLAVGLGVRGRRTVVLLDTYETAAPLDDWLREQFLPKPADSLMVLAGREPPAAAWRSEAAWRELLRAVALRNLGPEESRAYLGAAGVPKALHEPVLAFTHGHPLALSLVVDVLAQEQRHGLAGFTPSMPPTSSASCWGASLPTFPAICTGARWRCAHARLTTEALLRAALDAGDVHDIFEWLRSLSFIEQAVRPDAARPGQGPARRRPALARPRAVRRPARPRPLARS